MKDRIQKIIQNEGLNQQEFASKLKISASTLSMVLKGKSGVTQNHVSAIHNAFPQVNINWLMFGEGDMYVAKADNEMGTLFDDEMGRDGSVEQQVTYNSPAQVGQNLQPSEPQNDNRYVSQGDKAILPKVIFSEKASRKIIEVRVFFDDGTYETFT